MDAIRRELMAYLTGKRDQAIAKGKYQRAYWLSRWICYIRQCQSNRELADYYCELYAQGQRANNQQLSLF